MASSIGAENRITALLFGGAKPSHPTTISGASLDYIAGIGTTYRDIYSYGLVIVRKEGDAYRVKSERNSSLTTNRHLGAAWTALEKAGYIPTDETERGYTRWVKATPEQMAAFVADRRAKQDAESAAYWAKRAARDAKRAARAA